MEMKATNEKIGTITTRLACLAACLLVILVPLSNIGRASAHTDGDNTSNPAAVRLPIHSLDVTHGAVGHDPPESQVLTEKPTKTILAAGRHAGSLSFQGLSPPETQRYRLMPGPAMGESTLSGLPSVSMQVAPAQDATLSSLAVTADGTAVAVTPAFSSEITNYTARVNAATINLEATATRPGARIVSIALGGVSALLNPDDNLLSAAATLTEGATTHFSLTVRAADGVTTENYVIAFSRPGDPAVPDITIEASRAEYVAGLGNLEFTLTRGGDAAESLDVTVDLAQSREWLNNNLPYRDLLRR